MKHVWWLELRRGKGNGWGMVSVNCKVFKKGVWFPFSCCTVKPSTTRCTVTWLLYEYWVVQPVGCLPPRKSCMANTSFMPHWIACVITKVCLRRGRIETKSGHCEIKLGTEEAKSKMQRDSKSTEHYSRLDEHWCPLVAEMRTIFKTENWKKIVVVLQFGAYRLFMW